MAAKVHPLPLFLPCPGEPALVDAYVQQLLVINATGNAWPDAQWTATLLHCLGAEGVWTFYSLTNTGDTISSAVVALQKHFSPKVNIFVLRHAIRQPSQAPH
ncbi:hypothetical protein ATANTOWER_032626 [Ataeniobius toweri]|uniref:Uncharacterized protein n=1 Tax=Ataeniobius toweri TaxID=208326 RepID=A0ABU7AX98_9TELE|nr:hypothetical protein [Ataeniobius toweri]